MDEATKQWIETIRDRVMKPRPFGKMDRDDREFLDQIRSDCAWLVTVVEGNSAPVSGPKTPKKKA